MSKKIAAANIRIKRAYQPAEDADGKRILIDRLWPRGVKKADAAIDQWAKDLAPGTALRQWFGHDPQRWPEFCQRYAAELRQQPEPLSQLRALAQQQTITLVFAAHDEAHNNAVALRAFLLGRKIVPTA